MEKEWTEKCPVPEDQQEKPQSLALKKTNSEIKLTADETDHGPVEFKDIRNFFSFSSGLPGLVIFGIIAISCSVMQMAPTYIMSIWTELPLAE